MLGPPTERPKLLSGGAGLYSTAGDYLRFARMLCDGSLDGARIMKPETARAMREDQLEGRPVSGPMAAMLRDGFGLGVALIREPGRAGQPDSVGCGWVGAAGTSFWVDPDHGIAGVFLTQTWTRLDMGAAFQREAYAALH